MSGQHECTWLRARTCVPDADAYNSHLSSARALSSAGRSNCDFNLLIYQSRGCQTRTKILITKTNIHYQERPSKAMPRGQIDAGRFSNQSAVLESNLPNAERNEARADAGGPVSNVSENLRPLSDYSGRMSGAISSDGVEENDLNTVEEPFASFDGRTGTGANWNQGPSVENTDLRTDQPLTSENLESGPVSFAPNTCNIEPTVLSLESLDSRVASLEEIAKDGFQKIKMLETRMGSIETRVGSIESRVGNIEIDVGSIKRALENTRKR